MKRKTLFLLMAFCCVSLNLLYSQKSLVYEEPNAEYQKGIDLFNKEKFNAAQECFNKIIDVVKDEQSEIRIDAEYYSALCSIELYNSDADNKMMKFISTYPENSKIKYANFQLAKLLYRQKKYFEASKTFENVDITDLNSDDLAEYYFDYGYSCFILKKYDNAQKQFDEIKDADSKYYAPANYYSAHIDYVDKNYESALKSFIKIEKNDIFGSIVPYYIAQIYYLQGNYEEVIKYALPLDSINTKRIDEIARIIGESYFKTGNYANSIQYFEKYITRTTNTISRQDYYEMGYAYYKSGMDYQAAVDYLSAVVNGEDSLAQNAYYLLGDCYVKNGNKKFALNSFKSAYKLSFYPEIKEDALFNYAKLAYDLSLNPYNDAITSLQKYINDYPNSAKIDDARAYLINIFLTTKNYKDALSSIEKIQTRDEKLNEAYQKIAFYRGVELFNDDDIDGAIKLFDKSNTQPINKTIKVQCYYWKGEGYYRQSKYDSARVYYDNFMLLPGAFSLPVFNTANYNIAYCYFKQKNYQSAIKNFRKFITGKSTESERTVNDAYLRIGDCYYISKQYEDALEYYHKAIIIKSFDTDYALFQKSLCLGALGKYSLKISSLNDMLEQYPKSSYTEDAKFELANSYLINNETENALNYFNKIISDYPKSSYAKLALLKIGMIYFNTDKDDQAIQTYKKVVIDYPATPESKSAIESMLNIYMDIDKVDSFYVWVKNRGIEYGSKTKQDSITYIASENRYMNGDTAKAVNGFNNYIKQFPDGYFVTNAYYYKAESDFKNNNIENALKEYIFVATQPQNKFSEYALLKAAEICYKLNRFDSSSYYYSLIENNPEYKSYLVEARCMKMRCYWKTGKYDNAIKAARALIATENVPDESLAEAHITIGRSALKMDSIALAQTEFEFTYKQSPTSEYSAEAKYNIAYIQYKLQEYTPAEKTIFEVINQVPSYDYWIAKSFILLADIYIETGNIAQAKATLQSIIDNSDNTELVTLAHEKLNKLNRPGIIPEQKDTMEDIQINLNNIPKNDKQFNDKKLQKEEKKNE